MVNFSVTLFHVQHMLLFSFFKVVARIVLCTRPAISLGELMTQEQLLHLVRLAVWNDQHKASWGGPWASHAICCLLQDILEG